MPTTPKPGLKIENVKIDTLLPHPDNPRLGKVDVIAESLETLDQYKPIVVQKGTRYVLAGNHTLFAAQSLGWDQIQAVFVDVDEEKAKRILLVDNRTSDLGDYDPELLVSVLQSLPDLTGTGYDPGDLEDLIQEEMLPAPIPLPQNTAAAGEEGGKNVPVDNITWGYLQFAARRVQISVDEVERLNACHDAYVQHNATDAGFGHAVADGLDDILKIDSDAVARAAQAKQ